MPFSSYFLLSGVKKDTKEGIDSHSGGDDDAAHALGDVLALEDVVGSLHILQAAVGAAADDYLIDSLRSFGKLRDNSLLA